MYITGMKIAGLVQPLGLDNAAPDLTWTIACDQEDRNIIQCYWEVSVCDNEGKEIYRDRSRDEEDGRNQRVTLALPGLKAKTGYTARISVRLTNGETLSAETTWKTGFLGTAWAGAWIGPEREKLERVDIMAFLATMNPELHITEKPADSLRDLYPAVHFDKEFTIKDKPVRSAGIYATAHGVYELRLDEQKVGDLELAPEFSAYNHLLQYQTYDVTEYFARKQGEKVSLQALLGDGYYIGRIGIIGIGYEYGDHIDLLAQIEIEYEDGEHEIIATDPSWKYGETNIRYSDIFIGEKTDLTMAWEEPIHDPVVFDEDMSVLTGQCAEPLRVTEQLPAVEILHTPAGETVIDFGQVLCGTVSITLEGTAGEEIVLEHQETLDQNGNFFFNIPRFNCEMQDVYILKDGQQTLRPVFTVHGFRYVRVTGYSGILKKENCRALVIGSDLKKTGSFTCSDERLNQLQHNIEWSQKSNFFSVPIDCPQRERAGWTGDIQVYGPTAAFNYDVLAFLKRWLTQVRMEQLPDGQIPVVVPYTPGYQQMQHNIGGDSSAGWGDVCVMLPWNLYQAYGDLSVLRENYNTMENWLEYIRTMAAILPDNHQEMSAEQLEHSKYLWTEGFHYGDWLYPSAVDENGNSNAFLSSALTRKAVAPIMYAMSVRTMIKVCHALGYTDKEKDYCNLYEHIKEAYAAECIDADGRIQPDLQGIYTLALAMDLVPASLTQAAADHLADLIHQWDDRLDVGFLSIPYFLDVLYEHGHPQLAYQLLYSEKCPSWLYEVSKGATTIWESWDAIRPDGVPNETSFNHYAFGCVGSFMYKNILGIRADEPGYRKFTVAPDPACGLSRADGGIETIYGPIRVSWKLTDGKYCLDVVVPPNTTADILINNQGTVIFRTVGSGIVESLGDLAYGCSKDGHVYGITGAAGGSSTGFLANSNILEECGIDTTDRTITVEELEEIFATVKAAKGDGFYCVSGGGGFNIVGEAYDSLGSNEYNGVVLLDGDTTQVVDMYESDAYMEYAERMYDWAQKGYISPDAATTEDSVQTQLATQNYLGAFSYTDQEGVKTSYNSSGAFPLTALTLQDAVTRTSDLTDVMFGIASTCENPEKAMAFLNLLYTDPDLESILANGIEGTHYQVVEENEEGQKIVTFADGVDMSTSGYYVALNVWALNPNTSWSSFEALDETATRRAYPTSPAFGYAFDSTDVSTETTALSAVYNEYNTIINCGAVDPATEVPAFIQALKDAGIEKVVEANQEQYTEWQNAQ